MSEHVLRNSYIHRNDINANHSILWCTHTENEFTSSEKNNVKLNLFSNKLMLIQQNKANRNDGKGGGGQMPVSLFSETTAFKF
jgi:hypothetical protein